MFRIFSGFFCGRKDCLKTKMSSKSHISKKCLKNMLSYIMFRRRRWRLFFHATWLSGGGDKTFSIGYVLYFSSICLFMKSYKKEATNNSFFTLYLNWPKDSHLLNRVHDLKKKSCLTCNTATLVPSWYYVPKVFATLTQPQLKMLYCRTNQVLWPKSCTAGLT